MTRDPMGYDAIREQHPEIFGFDPSREVGPLDAPLPRPGVTVIVTGRCWLPHLGVSVELDRPAKFTVADVTADNYGRAIHLEHEAGVSNLYADPDDIAAGRTTLSELAQVDVTPRAGA